MKKLTLLALFVFAAATIGCSKTLSSAADLLDRQSEKTIISLVDNWSFRAADSLGTSAPVVEWMEAKVPGVVHTDLIAAGVIGEPFASTTEPTLQWIEHKEWHYQTNFTLDESFFANQNKELIFKGLDTYAEVYLNDSLILEANNMFLEWRIDVDSIARQGDNHLLIKFLPAYAEGLKEAAKYNINFPADNDKGEVKTSVFTRKAPYHFGWDWGPRYVTCGVWRPVSIESWGVARIDNVQFIQKSQSEAIAEFDANITLQSSSAEDVALVVCDSVGNIYANQVVTLAAGENRFSLPFSIENPKLWWPHGTGEPNLYPTRVIVANKCYDKKYDSYSANIGVRTIKLIQKPDSVGDGVSFYFEVNGEPIFAKGANYIPQDVFLPRVTVEKYGEFIDVCTKSNFNMIRVWGGGIYEEDLFFDLCDRNGLMVWQDFTFGCSLYPWDSAFLKNVEKEAIYNVRRLRNHPSLAIWCGNNEITELWHHWGYQEAYGWDQAAQDSIFAGMESLFYKLLPDVLSNEDTTRFYHPSSPLYGRGNPKSQIMGDVHYWGVFHDEEPFSVYKDKPGRFSNEYGFQSLACYDTYREYFTEEDMQLYSPAMIIHQKNPKGYRVIEEYMVRDLPLLKDDLRTYIYLTQILQAEGIKIAMEGHRQKRPFTMGSLYWQINDCWPVASWSSMDSEMRWKALQYYAVNSFAPTALSFEAIDSTNQVKLWGVTDKLEAKTGNVKLTLVDFNGKVLSTEQLVLNIPRNGNQEILHSTASELLQGSSPRQVALVAETEVDGKPLRAIHYFVPFKDLQLPKVAEKSGYTVDYVKGENGRVTATIKANKLLKNVLFEAIKIQNNASDAYFDMLPGESRTIELSFKQDAPIEELGIFVTTLNNIVGRPSEKPIKENAR